MKELGADVVVVGGETAGSAAALAAARMGRSVIMTKETDWIGGQLTSQAVPPDEHPWFEEFGCTRSYRRFRPSRYPTPPSGASREVRRPASSSGAE